MLPEFLGEFCFSVADSIQVPLELVVSLTLEAVATAIQGKLKVEVRHDYCETVNLYQCCALPPGERKSAVVEICKRPLIEWENEQRQQLEEVVRAVESEIATMEQAITAKRKEIGKASTVEDRRAIIEEVKQLESELPDSPVIPRLLADDATPEALAEIMERQGGRIAIIEAEGGIIDTMGGRYSKGIPNLDLILKAYGGETVHIDRKGRQPIVIEKPSLPLALCPQPAVIASMKGQAAFRGRGLVGRFLFWLPQSLMGRRSIEPAAVPELLLSKYAAMLFDLLAIKSENESLYSLNLEPAAYEVWKEFATALEKEQGRGGEFEYMTDWTGKLPGQATRIAAILHCAEQTSPQTHNIGESTMLAA